MLFPQLPDHISPGGAGGREGGGGGGGAVQPASHHVAPHPLDFSQLSLLILHHDPLLIGYLHGSVVSPDVQHSPFPDGGGEPGGELGGGDCELGGELGGGEGDCELGGELGGGEGLPCKH